MPDQRDQQKQQGGQPKKPGSPQLVRPADQQQDLNAHTDQISFYDESLKKQIEGSFVSDGKSIHVSSVYGSKSFPYNDLGACIDYNAEVSFVKKVLSELARDPGSGKFKDLQQQKGDQEPMHESNSSWGGGSGSGANP